MSKHARVIAAVVLALAVAGTMALNALWLPASAPANAASCQQWVAPHPAGQPAWKYLHGTGDCGAPVEVKRCVAGISGSTLLGFLGLPVGPIAGFLGGALGCGTQFIK